jgi:hypothetical protein
MESDMPDCQHSISGWKPSARDAFPQYPDRHYVEPRPATKVYDILITIAVLAVFAIMGTMGTVFFFGG